MAVKQKSIIVTIAEEKFAEARELVEDSPKKAKSALKKISKEFKGLEVAKEADALLKTIDA